MNKNSFVATLLSAIVVTGATIFPIESVALDNKANELNKSTEITVAMPRLVDKFMDTIIEKNIEEPDEKVAEEPPEPEMVKMELPNVNGSFKAYMDYRCISDTCSKQYKLQQKAYTDKNGLRKVGNDYCVALGTGFSSKIGTRFEITLSSGNTFTVILADVKSNRHTDDSNKYCLTNNSIVEFVVDTYSLNSNIKLRGSVGALSSFEGSVKAIKKIKE